MRPRRSMGLIAAHAALAALAVSGAAHAQEGDPGVDLDKVVPEVFNPRSPKAKAKAVRLPEPAARTAATQEGDADPDNEAPPEGVPDPPPEPADPAQDPTRVLELKDGTRIRVKPEAIDAALGAEPPPAEAKTDTPTAAPDAAEADAGRPDAPPTPFEPDWVELGRESDLRDLLEAHARASRSGDNAGADLALARIEEVKTRIAVRNAPLVTATLIHEARLAIGRGDLGRAIAASDAAARLSPDVPSAHWMRLQAKFLASKTSIPAFAGIFWDVLRARTGGFRNQIALASDLLAIAGLAFLAFAAAFGLIQCAKYLRYVSHDLVRHLPLWVSERQGAFTLVLLWATPVVLGAGLLASAALWIASVLAYQTRRERAVGVAAIVTLASFPALIFLAAPLITFHGSVTDALDRVATEAFAGDAEERLEQHLEGAGKQDFEAAMGMAMRARTRGDLAGAIQGYKDALAIRPGNAAAKNNLGVLYYYLQRKEEALEQFRQAAGSRSRAEPWLNIASIVVDDSHFDEARAAIAEARQIDAKLTRRYNDLGADTSTVRKLSVVPFEHAVLWERLAELDTGTRMAVVSQIAGALGGRVPAIFISPFAIVLLLIASFFALRRDQMLLSRACSTCGMPAYPEAPQGFCEQCQSILLNSAAVDPRKRAKKQRRIRGYQRRMRWIERTLALIPGAGDLFAGRTLRGAFTMLLAFFALFAVLWVDRFSTDSWLIWSVPAFPLMGLCVFFALALAVFSLRRAFR